MPSNNSNILYSGNASRSFRYFSLNGSTDYRALIIERQGNYPIEIDSSSIQFMGENEGKRLSSRRIRLKLEDVECVQLRLDKRQLRRHHWRHLLPSIFIKCRTDGNNYKVCMDFNIDKDLEEVTFFFKDNLHPKTDLAGFDISNQIKERDNHNKFSARVGISLLITLIILRLYLRFTIGWTFW